jgi:Transposase IS116/IS110/IS902 family
MLVPDGVLVLQGGERVWRLAVEVERTNRVVRLAGPGGELEQLAGVAPLEASSAGRVRHRLNRGGNRRPNAILHRIAVVRARSSPADPAAGRAVRTTPRPPYRPCLREYVPGIPETPDAHDPAPAYDGPTAPLGRGLQGSGGLDPTDAGQRTKERLTR